MRVAGPALALAVATALANQVLGSQAKPAPPKSPIAENSSSLRPSASLAACDAFRLAISVAETSLSVQELDGMGDSSAPREQLKLQRASNAWSSIPSHANAPTRTLLSANRSDDLAFHGPI
jgi:hypothetical protein